MVSRAGALRERVGAEASPGAAGMSAQGLAEALDLVRARGARAQLVVIRRGRVVVDRAFGCPSDGLFWAFSAGKPLLALLIHRLAELRYLSLGDPVARFWPQFAAHGKGRVTIRHVLEHRSGLANGGTPLGDALAMGDWQRSVRRIASARLRHPPGGVVAYQFLAFGFILGEVARRATRRPLRSLLAELVFAPMGLRDTYLGLPPDLWERRVPARAAGPAEAPVARVVNSRRIREALIPAAGISTSARQLARLYATLEAQVRLGRDGPVLRAETLRAALRPTSEHTIDRATHYPIRWSQGFQLGGPRWVPGTVSPLGAHSSPRSFGHNGSNCCIGWADPTRGLAMAYLTERLGAPLRGLRHFASVSDALLAACAR